MMIHKVDNFDFLSSYIMSTYTVDEHNNLIRNRLRFPNSIIIQITIFL